MGDCLRDMVLMHERPATDKRPPATDKRPPASDKRPPASDKRPPASDKRFPDPLKTLEKMKSASHGLHFKCDTNYLEKCISCCIDKWVVMPLMSCDCWPFDVVCSMSCDCWPFDVVCSMSCDCTGPLMWCVVYHVTLLRSVDWQKLNC